MLLRLLDVGCAFFGVFCLRLWFGVKRCHYLFFAHLFARHDCFTDRFEFRQ
ncbi:MAG: hypothetical protein ACI85K_000437 [Hyphomicrobiaceae bacterium]|jgi:hypothetical protein